MQDKLNNNLVIRKSVIWIYLFIFFFVGFEKNIKFCWFKIFWINSMGNKYRDKENNYINYFFFTLLNLWKRKFNNLINSLKNFINIYSHLKYMKKRTNLFYLFISDLDLIYKIKNLD